MAIVETPSVPPVTVRTERGPWLACGLAVLSATSYVVSMVFPYLAAGRPAPGSLYLVDYGAQWPVTSAAEPLVALLSFWAVGVAPFVSFSTAGWSALRLWTTRHRVTGRVPLWTALLVSGATFVWFCTPLSAALLGWMIG